MERDAGAQLFHVWPTHDIPDRVTFAGAGVKTGVGVLLAVGDGVDEGEADGVADGVALGVAVDVRVGAGVLVLLGATDGVDVAAT
jgi:hypothetical protein